VSSEVGAGGEGGAAARSDSPSPAAAQGPPAAAAEESQRPPDPELEKRLLGYLCDLSLSLPTESLSITSDLSTVRNTTSRLLLSAAASSCAIF